MTPYEYRAVDLDYLEHDHEVTIKTFWTEHDDLIGDVLHARTEDGRHFQRIPLPHAAWEEVPGKDIDVESKALWVLLICSKVEQIIELFQTREQAAKWLARWVHKNKYEEMDVLDEGAHDDFQNYWEDGHYEQAADLYFDRIDDYYYIHKSDVHPASEKIGLYS